LYARFKTLKENPENVWTLEDQPHGKHQTKEEGKLRRPRPTLIPARTTTHPSFGRATSAVPNARDKGAFVMSNTQIHLTTFDEAARRLHARWAAAAEHWRDGVQREFAQHHYAPLQQEHGRMAAKATALIAALQSARRSVK
jgi:hypothetical protein